MWKPFSLSLNFTQTSSPNKIGLNNDVQKFTCKLRLPNYLYRENKLEENKSCDVSIITKKSVLNTPRNKDKITDQNIDSEP